MKAILHHLISDEQAASMPEAAFLIALIAVVAIGAISQLGGGVWNTFSFISEALRGPELGIIG